MRVNNTINQAEINKKSIEIDETIREKERINIEKDKYKHQIEKLKIDLIKIKKVYETEKEMLFKQKIDEVEKLKFEIFNQKASQKELQELGELRLQVKGNIQPEAKK